MKKLLSVLAVLLAVLLLQSPAAYAETGNVVMTFWGQSAFKLESGGKTILIDPWITENPACQGIITVEDITRADLILITHDHFDHVGDTMAGGHAADTIAIARNTGATVVAVYETLVKLVEDGLPRENALFGGYGRLMSGLMDVHGVSLAMTPAVHSSNSGVPAGYIIKFPGGATVYHAGDTAIFSDMQIYGMLYPMDIALLPIGGGFTMDAMQAAESLRLLRPGKAIPMHYGTFPMLAPNADQFVRLAKKAAPKVDVIILKPGERYVLRPGHYHPGTQ